MRKLVLFGLTVTTVFAVAAIAVAQQSAAPVVTVTGEVTPAQGGTKKKPKNAGVNIKFDVNPESFSTLAGIDYGIPKNLRISGKGFKRCSAQTVNTKGETDGCKGVPVVGTGAATALVGPGQAPTSYKVNVYADGPKGLTLALQQLNSDGTNGPLAVAFAAKIVNNRVAFAIPGNIQQPAPGVYSYVTSVTANLGPAKITKTIKKKVKGKKKKQKVKKTYFLVSRTGCTGGSDVIDVKLDLAANPTPPAVDPATGTVSVPCSK